MTWCKMQCYEEAAFESCTCLVWVSWPKRITTMAHPSGTIQGGNSIAGLCNETHNTSRTEALRLHERNARDMVAPLRGKVKFPPNEPLAAFLCPSTIFTMGYRLLLATLNGHPCSRSTAGIHASTSEANSSVRGLRKRIANLLVVFCIQIIAF